MRAGPRRKLREEAHTSQRGVCACVCARMRACVPPAGERRATVRAQLKGLGARAPPLLHVRAPSQCPAVYGASIRAITLPRRWLEDALCSYHPCRGTTVSEGVLSCETAGVTPVLSTSSTPLNSAPMKVCRLDAPKPGPDG